MEKRTSEGLSIKSLVLMMIASIGTFLIISSGNHSQIFMIQKTIIYQEEYSDKYKVQVITIHPADDFNKEEQTIVKTTNLTTGKVEIRLNNPEDYCLSF